MAKTMKAAMVRKFKEPLSIDEVPVPEVKQGQILVKIEACGVCHTDLHAADGDWPVKPSPPFIPGHEGVGTVAAVGGGVTAVKEGDRVGIPWLHTACGHCRHCLAAWETLCDSQQNTGYSVNGGFAEYSLADPNYVGHLPHGLDFEPAAPILCAGVTVYKGLKETEAKPGDTVVISGIGGLRRAEDIAPAFEAAKGRAEAIFIAIDPLVTANRIGISILAAGAKLPTICAQREFVDAGALISYGPNFPELFRRAGDFVDKILRGAKPADLPVEQPTKFDLVVNLTTAKALGLAIPQSLLAIADEVIE